VHHHDAGSQYTSIAFTDRLAAAGVDASVGSVGDAFDDALAESTIGLYKTELIKPRAPWRRRDQVEITTPGRLRDALQSNRTPPTEADTQPT
jgi:putative transposase